jgi:hypothetical protein
VNAPGLVRLYLDTRCMPRVWIAGKAGQDGHGGCGQGRSCTCGVRPRIPIDPGRFPLAPISCEKRWLGQAGRVAGGQLVGVPCECGVDGRLATARDVQGGLGPALLGRVAAHHLGLGTALTWRGASAAATSLRCPRRCFGLEAWGLDWGPCEEECGAVTPWHCWARSWFPRPWAEGPCCCGACGYR